MRISAISTRYFCRSWLLGTLLSALGALAGCGQQATEEYPGEAMLALKGQAVVEADTGGLPLVPALCFKGKALDSGPFDRSLLPPEAQELLSLPEGFVEPEGPPLGVDPFPVDRRETHIVDVASHGQFPAQFDIGVYEPPPEVVWQASFEGEPRTAVGFVCAVLEDHEPITQPIYRSGFRVCDAALCVERTLYATPDGDPSYVEASDCPVEDEGACETATYGNSALQYQTIAAGVIAESHDAQLLYLAEPAPPGSYTAWRYGAADGLDAGYHVFAAPQDPIAHMECELLAREDALAEIRDTYEARMIEEYGPSATLQNFPLMSVGSAVTYVPDDVYQGGLRIQAEYAMDSSPMPPSLAIAPSDADVSLSLEGANADP